MNDTAVLRHHLTPLAPLLEAPDVTELAINRTGEVGVEGPGGWRWHDAPDLTQSWLSTLATTAAAFTNQDVTASEPVCSTVLPGGERCQIVLPPAAESISFKIRRPSSVEFGMQDVMASGLFEGAKSATEELAPEETELMALRDAGRWPEFFELAVRRARTS